MTKHIPLKKFGQNFLMDKNILKKISEIIDLKNKVVIEIGPGTGNLTSYLIEKAKKIIAFEIDNNLFQLLNEKFDKTKNLQIINVDFLKFNLNKIEEKELVLVSNIPYNITTDILFKLFKADNINEIVLMTQKEFAQRMCAKIKTKEYGKLAITTSVFYDCKIIFNVSPNAFNPKPKVDSSIIYLKRIKNSLFKNDNEKYQFIKFINICFSMKRKTLWNNLKHFNLDLQTYNEFCKNSNIKNNVRPEELNLKKYVSLFQILKNNL